MSKPAERACRIRAMDDILQVAVAVCDSRVRLFALHCLTAASRAAFASALIETSPCHALSNAKLQTLPCAGV